jgi:hypothetical protein
MLSAHARHVASAEAADVTSAEAADVTSAEAADVTSAKATDVTSAKATDVAAAETTHVAAAAAAMSPAPAAAATAGLCTRCKKATGKHGTCHNHHHSSSHDISFEMGHRALGCRDGDACLSAPLNSRSMIGNETTPDAGLNKATRALDQQLSIKGREGRMLFQPRSLDRLLS